MPIRAKSKKVIVHEVMREYYKGPGIHSGKGGPKVKSRKQAIAIALSEARRRGYK